MNAAAPELQELAEWAANLTFEDVPDQVVEQAQWCVLDLLGVAIAATGNTDLKHLIEAERALDGGEQVRVWTTGDRFSAPTAARINAFSSSLTELADNVSVHANESNIPLAFAYAENHKISGKDLLLAIVIGAETARRLHDVYFDTKKPDTEFPVGVPSALNTFGASFVAAKLLGLNAQQTLDSANVALNLIASALECSVHEGTPLKPMLFGGWPSGAGFTAATYAAHGITASPQSLTKPVAGWLPGAANEWDLAELTKDLGERWELERPDRKRHASCGFSHAGLDGAMQLAEQAGVSKADEIDQITVKLFPFGAKAVGGPIENITSSTAAKFNLRYLIANVLDHGGVVTIEDTDESVIPERLANAKLRALMDKITIEPDESITLAERFAANVTLTLPDGTSDSVFIKDARGKGQNQFTKDEIDEKFFTLTTPVIGEDRAEKIREAVDNITSLDSAAAVIDLVVGE